MLRVAIIDDEPLIRRGIRSMVNWAVMGCEICGEAADGQQGEELIERCRPQIVITDIRMPEKDGLSMIRRVKRFVSDCKIIILTGYRNFEYAQEAVRLGAFDYVMKPTKLEELQSTVSRAIEAIKAEEQDAGEVDQLRQQNRQDERIVKERLLYNMMIGVDAGTGENAAVRAGLEEKLKHYVLGLLEMRPSDFKEEQDARLRNFSDILEVMRKTFQSDFLSDCIALSSNTIACVVSLPDGEKDWKPALTRDCLYVQRCASEEYQMTAGGSFSSEGSGAETLPEKLKECRKVLEYRPFLGYDSAIFYSDLKEYAVQNESAFLYDRQNRLLEHIYADDLAGVSQDIRDIAACMNGSKKMSWQFISNFYFDTILRIYAIRRELAKSPDGFARLFSMIECSKSVNELSDLLSKIALREAESISKPGDTPGLLMRKALEYIDGHYREDITLGDVAEHIYASSCYTCHMFKKELGVNFVDYLNKLRIDHAKKLLAESHYKIYEVAEAVGIPNEHYFSTLFKRYIGMTASEYRQSLSLGPVPPAASEQTGNAL